MRPKKNRSPFHDPIYITRPIIPEKDDFFKLIEEIFSTKQLTNNGPKVQEFSQKLIEYLEVPQLSLFCNGTLALLLACQALRLSGEVITTPFTFAATPHILYWNSIRPVFCDIQEETGNIDPGKIDRLITPKTTAILPVHVFGNPCDVHAINDIADRHGLKIIYDAAHCFGVRLNDLSIGCYGDITAFSFHSTKIFHSIEGGALTYADESIKRRVELARNFGFEGEESVVVPGINAKMNEIQAAMGIINLSNFEDERLKRKLLTDVYRENLKDVEGLSFFEQNPNSEPNYYNFVIKIDEEKYGRSRDYVYDNFKNFNIFTRKYFYPLCSRFQCYRSDPSSNPEYLPIATRVSKQVLSLPLYGSLEYDDIKKICDILISFHT
jgi:dTDP-4-amino-4,6-dideoxygalactose transaminase